MLLFLLNVLALIIILLLRHSKKKKHDTLLKKHNQELVNYQARLEAKADFLNKDKQ